MTPTTVPEFAAAAKRFQRGAQEIINRYFAAQYPSLTPSTLTIDPQGQRYLRIVSTNDGGRGQRSVFAFLDATNGDVLKPASWRAPAKHARGNLFDPSGGLAKVGPYGPAYLR